MSGKNSIINQDVDYIIKTVGKDWKKLEGKTLLLTGASGFLPSYFVETIAVFNQSVFKNPCQLLAISRSTPTSRSRLVAFQNNPHIKLLAHDVSKPFPIDDSVDFIIHAASRASPRDYRGHPLDTIDTNINGTRYLLEYARQNPVKSFLFFSSGEIYGNPPTEYIPTPETYLGNVDPSSPRACYTESKRLAETLCSTFYREYGVPVKIVRPFHVYGPGQRLDDGRVMADFLNNGLHHQPIVLLSEGKAKRAFCYIADATVGFWKALLSEHHGEVFNIGNDHPEISMADLAKLFSKLFDNLEVEFQISEKNKYLTHSPERCCPDISKAQKMLRYQPRFGLEEGIKRTIQWYRESV